MNAPEVTPIAQQNIALAQLIPSPTNPRKRFDETKLQELANSIKMQGVLQPLLVRTRSVVVQSKKATDWPFPMPGKLASETTDDEISKVTQYEIIAGERRYRAAKLAGLIDAPCFVRELNDLQVLHAQVIENLQRDDLHELEEAEGYERLMQEKDSEGNPYTADTIAAEVGKSRAYVYARLKLLALCDEAREAFFRGELDASRALLIARIPVHKLQLKVLALATAKNEYYQRPNLSYRQLRDLIQNDYMLDLASAPFDTKDATLHDKAGSCIDCQKRTGNQPELFDDVGSKDVCTDPVCHAMKKTAHVLRLQKAAEEQGNKLLLGKDAKKLIPNYMKTPEDHLLDHGLIMLEAKVPGDEQHRTFGQILKEAKLLSPTKETGKPIVGKTIVQSPHNSERMMETVNIEAATKALREAGFDITLKGKPEPKQKDNTRQREKDERELAIENAYRAKLFDTLHTRIEKDMTDPESGTFPVIYRMLAIELMDRVDPDEDDMKILMTKYTAMPEAEEGDEIDWESHITEFRDNIANLTPAQHLMLAIELSLMSDELSVNQYWNRNNSPKSMLSLSKELDIDADAIKKEAAAELKAAAAAAKKAAAKPAKIGARTKKPQDGSEHLTIKTAKFGLLPNEHGVYTCAPDETFEWKQGRQSVTVELLELENNIWIYNIDVFYGDGSASGPLSYQPYNSADSREAALQKIKEDLQGGGHSTSNFKGAALKSFQKWLETFPPKDDPKPTPKTRPACEWPFPSPGKSNEETTEENGGAA